jgi:molybdenum cofactor cytidylyltransferase
VTGGRSGTVAAAILAAGAGRRMAPAIKPLIEVDGRPMVDLAVDAALGAGLDPVLVVVGHGAGPVRAVLDGRPVTVVDNPLYGTGRASSIRAAIAALPDGVRGAVILLADMPRVRAEHVRRLLAAFADTGGVCLPVHGGRRGNPVLWPKRAFTDLLALADEQGGRTLFDAKADEIVEVDMADDGVLIDVDDVRDLERLAAADDRQVRR